MRDIRPSGSLPPSKKKPPFPPEDDKGIPDDLQDFYNSAKEERKKIRSQAKQTGSSDIPKKPKKPRLTGSSVPVGKVHVPLDEPEHREPAGAVSPPPSVPPVSKPKETAKPKARPLFATKPKDAPKLKKSSSKGARVGHKERKIIAGLIVLLLIVGLLGAWLFLPKATITLVLRTAPLLVDEEVVIQAETGSANVVPGTALFREVQVEGVAPVTGVEVVGEKARGTVQIVNRTLEEQSIKEESRLVTEDGTLFYMQGHAIVPPATSGAPSRVSVTVEAAEAGEVGNIEPQRLDFAALPGESQQVVYAEATQALTGGSGEEVKVVSEGDLDRVEASASQAARDQVEDEMRSELPDGLSILDESWSVDVDSLEVTAEVGDRSEEIAYSGRAVVRVLGYEEESLDGYLRTILEGQLDDEFVLFPGPISYTKSVEEVDWESGRGVLDVRVTHTTIPDFSLETLQQKVAGRSEDEALQYLRGLPGVQTVELDLWPFWVQSIPRIEKRVDIEVVSERQP